MSTRRILRRDEERSSSSPSPPPRQRAGVRRAPLQQQPPAAAAAAATARPSLVRPGVAAAADAWPPAAAASANWAPPQRRRTSAATAGSGRRDDCLQRWLRRLRLAFCCGAKAATSSRDGASGSRRGAVCRPLPVATTAPLQPPPLHLRTRCSAAAATNVEAGGRSADCARLAEARNVDASCEMALLQRGRGRTGSDSGSCSDEGTPFGARRELRPAAADRRGGWGGYSDTASTSSTSSMRSTSYFRSEESISSSDSRCSSAMYTDDKSCLSSVRTSSVNASDEGTYRSPRHRRRQPDHPRRGSGHFAGNRQQRSWSNSSGSSCSSSMTDSTVSLNVITVTISTDATNFLGISIVGQSGSSGDGGIYVGSVMHGGAVDLDGRIEAGDMILEVNGLSFDRLSNDEAVRLLRDAVKKPGPVTLVVAKCWEAGALMAPPIRGGADRQQNTTISPRQEPVRPIDPLAWVAHTTALQSQAAVMQVPQQQPTRIAQGVPAAVPSTAVTAASAHRSAYESRRTAADGSTDSASTCSSADATLLPDAAYGASPHYASTVAIGKLDAVAVVAAMSRPDSGLDVRDRTWLKVTIPSAFIGSDLVDWLLTKVKGFADRSDACSYAASLLKSGHIQHTVNKEVFSEQCYYIFGNASLSRAPSGSKSSYSNPTCSVSPTDVRPPSLPRYAVQQPYAVTSLLQEKPHATSTSPWRGNQSGADRAFKSPSSGGQSSAARRPLLPRPIAAVPADLTGSRASFHAAMENPWDDDLCAEQDQEAV